MEKLVMDRRASDNEYLHKDFHIAFNHAIEYLHRNYGEDAVRDYLNRFTKAYYAPLISELKTRGLIALKEYFERIYHVEGGDVNITLNDDELIVNVKECPVMSHFKKNNIKAAELFYETTRTINEALCEGTPYEAEFYDYNEDTGSNIQRFVRRQKL